MIKFNRVRLAGRTNIDLPITKATLRTPFQVLDIQGLGPSEVDVLIGTSINGVGSFHGRRPRARQIVITIKLNPDYSVDESYAALRHQIYEMMSTPDGMFGIILGLDSGDSTEWIAGTNGWVSKLDIPLFDREPKVQLVIDCKDTDLKAVYPVEEEEFTEAGNVSREVFNVGNVASGFELNFTFNGNVTDGFRLTVDNPSLVEPQKLSLDYDFLTDDKLYFNTIPGNRYVALTRGTTEINMLPYLTGDWVMLMVGLNTVGLERITEVWSPIDATWGAFAYLPTYMGV